MNVSFFKKLACFVLSSAMIMGLSVTALASQDTNEALKDGYSQIANRAEACGLPFSMTFEEYANAFEESGFATTQEYADAYLGVMEPAISTYSSGSDQWYYDTGTSLPANAEPNYDKYHLYDTVKKGDLIFESKGGFGITGHIAIVEGKYYDAAKNMNYIRIIEAIDVGVVRSCLDDTRVDDKNVTLLRVSTANSDQVSNAVSFCVNQLGKKYSLDFGKDTSASEKDWYCSELVWAGYKNQGIDIETDGWGEPGVTPRDIKNSSKTFIINFK